MSYSFTTSNHHQHSRVSSTAVMHSVSVASGLTFEPGAHNVLICVACRSGSQCKQLHNWACMRIVITMMSSCTLLNPHPPYNVGSQIVKTLVNLVRKKGRRGLEEFLSALRKSANAGNQPGHVFHILGSHLRQSAT